MATARDENARSWRESPAGGEEIRVLGQCGVFASPLWLALAPNWPHELWPAPRLPETAARPRPHGPESDGLCFMPTARGPRNQTKRKPRSTKWA